MTPYVFYARLKQMVDSFFRDSPEAESYELKPRDHPSLGSASSVGRYALQLKQLGFALHRRRAKYRSWIFPREEWLDFDLKFFQTLAKPAERSIDVVYKRLVDFFASYFDENPDERETWSTTGDLAMGLELVSLFTESTVAGSLAKLKRSTVVSRRWDQTEKTRVWVFERKLWARDCPKKFHPEDVLNRQPEPEWSENAPGLAVRPVSKRFDGVIADTISRCLKTRFTKFTPKTFKQAIRTHHGKEKADIVSVRDIAFAIKRCRPNPIIKKTNRKIEFEFDFNFKYKIVQSIPLPKRHLRTFSYQERLERRRIASQQYVRRNILAAFNRDENNSTISNKGKVSKVSKRSLSKVARPLL